jgi:peptidoglycan/LPS O-acetylase OafA/YrhL
LKITLDSPPKDNGTAISQQFQASSRVGTNSPETKKAPQQIPVLDGIRAIACLIVLSYHMSILAHDYGILSPLQSTNQLAVIVTSFGAFFAQFGESGVILFFVLSGFLLFLPYAKALLIESPWPSPRR